MSPFPAHAPISSTVDHHQTHLSPMQYNTIRKLILALAVTLATALSASATERGWFGFGLTVETEGMLWNPTLVSMVISDVASGSPAATAGLAKGDRVVELEGQAIAGSKAKELQVRLESKVPGDKLVAVLKHASGEQYSATLIAAKKPAK